MSLSPTTPAVAQFRTGDASSHANDRSPDDQRDAVDDRILPPARGVAALQDALHDLVALLAEHRGDFQRELATGAGAVAHGADGAERLEMSASHPSAPNQHGGTSRRQHLSHGAGDGTRTTCVLR